MSAAPHPYIGMWVTADGRIRHELLPGGRRNETRHGRAHAYQGCHRITVSHSDDTDDSGSNADRSFVEADVLRHAEMALARAMGMDRHG